MLSCKQRRQLINIAEKTERVVRPSDDDAAFVTLMRICRDYADIYKYPLIQGEARDRWLAERLQKYRIKFFSEI